MAWASVLSLFEEKTLLESNWKGGVSRKKKSKHEDAKPLKALDTTITRIIKGKKQCITE